VIEIVSATRLPAAEFWSKSPLGISLGRLAHDSRLLARVAFENRRGLPGIYNARISADDGEDLLIFMHDDVWIDDYFLADRVIEGLRSFDLIGVAGNRRRVARQPAWAFVDTNLTMDVSANLSGSVAHGNAAFGNVAFFGAVGAECELLDGVFLAANKKVLAAKRVLFDPQFDFHFYDMDFCRAARQRGMRLGTWPICLTHQSGGGFGSGKWLEKYSAYLEKWGD
jgi:GT2 family glycosyltransferase